MSKIPNIFKQFIFVFFVLITLMNNNAVSQEHSIARKWNDALLEAIRHDFARPTVHARNLFHTSALMYDAWAIYQSSATTYMFGKTLNGYKCTFEGIIFPTDIQSAREKTLSYAVYTLLNHRFKDSPGAETSLKRFDDTMDELGFDKSFTSTDYSNGSYAALGNAMAACMIEYGLQDGSNEINDYINQFYQPVNDPLAPVGSGNPDFTNPNRWQPLALDVFIGQSGIIIDEFPEFLSPEWGTVLPFSLSDDDLTVNQRDGNDYWLYKDPGSPPQISLEGEGDTESLYKWNFSIVSKWSSHLDHTDGKMWDISPASIGNVQEFPDSFEKFDDFYNELEGGDPGIGRNLNPVTNAPYEAQIVPRGDYTRVLAEFWADGPDSETPPGHWFTLLNYVNDHPLVTKKFNGQGDVLSDLEWDVKSYFILGGAMHDSAIASWALKGWYDYPRPISVIRFMAGKGQSTDINDLNYDADGIPLSPGLIELIKEGDPLAGNNNVHVGKIKIYAWKGPDYIDDPEIDEAGVDWIRAEDWWPYQRPSFVTPPFAGFVSGHSTYSRAAAEVLTMLTGDEYFPGGMGEFFAEKNKFLVFEEGPSVDVTLQWATYRDASDQCSLSRIWGGIHPPADDIPGRIIGREIGVEAFTKAENYFNGVLTSINNARKLESSINAYPSPISTNQDLNIRLDKSIIKAFVQIIGINGQVYYQKKSFIDNNKITISAKSMSLVQGVYAIRVTTDQQSHTSKIIVK